MKNDLFKKTWKVIISLLMVLGLIGTNFVTTANAKDIGKKNEEQKNACAAVHNGDTPLYKGTTPYNDVLGNGSVYRGGNAKSSVREGGAHDLDSDPDDFANSLPYGNVFVDTNKLSWINPANFIIDIKDKEHFKWIGIAGNVLEDALGTKQETEPLIPGKTLTGERQDAGNINNGFIAYVGELKPYHNDIKAVPDDKADNTNIIEAPAGDYLYRITYLNAATLADGTRGNVVMTMTKMEFETSINVGEDNPRILTDKNGNTYQYTKAIVPIQGPNDLEVTGSLVDSEGNWVNEPNIVVKTKEEVDAAIAAAKAAGGNIPANYSDDKVIRHTIGGAYTFDIQVYDTEGNAAVGTMAYAAKDLDLPSYQTNWGRERGSDPFMYAEGLSVLSGTQSYALVPEYNHKDATTLAKGWVPDGISGSLDSPLSISGGSNSGNADGVRFASTGEKVMRDKNGKWDDVLFSGPVTNQGELMNQPTGTIMDFTWDNINNSRVRYKNPDDIWNIYINSTTYKATNIRRELAGKIKRNGTVVPWDQITFQEIIEYFKGGSYSLSRDDNATYDSGFAVLIDPTKTTFRWTGSTPQSGTVGTTLFDSTLFTYIEQTHGTGGGIYLESYDVGNDCNVAMNEGTVTMSRQSETTLTAVPEKGYRVNRILIGDTNYGDGSDAHSLQDYTEYVIDGNEIKVNGATVGTFTGTETVTDFDDLKTGVIELDGFKFSENSETKKEERVATAGNKKIRIERNADGTVDITLPEVDNPMHVHVDFSTDYYFYKVWVGKDEPTELKLTAAPYGFFPVEVTVPMPTGILDNEGIAITEDVLFKIDKNEYTAMNGAHEGKVFKLTPNGTLLYSETDNEGQETLRIESTYKLVGNEFVNETSGDKRQVTIEERIADWKSKYAISFKVDDTEEYKDYVSVSSEGDNTAWKIKYPSEGVESLNWKPLPVDATGERDDAHDAVTHTDRNYWFVIEDNVPVWTLDSYDNSAAKIPGAIPNVEGKDDYYNNSQWATDAIKNVDKATKLVQGDNKNTAAFLSVFEDGGKIANVSMAIVKGTKVWDDFDNQYNNRKDIWLHVDATIENNAGSTTSYKDVLPAQKVAKDAAGNELIKTWGNKKAYDTGDNSIKVVASYKDIPSKAKKQDDGSFVLNGVTYYVNELRKTNDKGIEYIYSIRETLENNAPVMKDNPDVGLLGYTSEDEDNKLKLSTTTLEGKEVTTYSGTVTNTLETIEYEATKIWDDNNDQDGYRTDIQLVLDGLEGNLPFHQERTKNISKDNNETTVTWTSLPKYENGKLVAYSVSEEGMDEENYSLDFKGEEDVDGNVTDVFTNMHIPETASISVFKKWDDEDNQDGLREELLEAVELQGKTDDEQRYGSAMAQDSSPIVKGTVPTEDGLIITWMNVPVKRNGKKITYKVVENIAGLTGYTTEPGGLKHEFTLTKNENKEATFTNRRTPDVKEITITKEWNDMDDKFGKRPEEITVQLKKTYLTKNDNEEEVDKIVNVNGEKYVVKTSTENIEYFKIDDKYYHSDDINKENAKLSDYEELMPFNPNNTGEVVQNGKFIDVDGEQYAVQITADKKEYYVIDGAYYDLEGNELIAGEGDFNPSDEDEYVTENITIEVDGTEYEIKLGNLAGEEQWYYEKDDKYYGWLDSNGLTKFMPSDDDSTVQIKILGEHTYGPETTETEDIVLKASENWTKTIQVPVNSSVAQKIAYGVDELVTPNGYTKDSVTSTDDGKFVVTNKILPPVAEPYETINYKGVSQTGTPTFEADKRVATPDGSENKIEHITLLDENGNETDTVTTPGEGTYTLNDDGTITFTPEPEFVGKTSGVNVRGYDSNGLYADTTYTPTVIHKVKYIDSLNPEDKQVVKGPEDSNTTDGSDVEAPEDYVEGEESNQHPGYRFDGWGAEEVDDPDVPGTKIIIRTAKYMPIYNINYDANGGQGTMEDNNYMADESEMPHDKNTFTRRGYTFIGFKAYIKDPTTGVESPILDASGEPIIFRDANDMQRYFKGMPGGTSIRMEAHWKRHEYHIHYDANGGTGTMTSQDFTGDNKSAVSKENTFTREGYRFKGFLAVTKDGKEIGFFTSTDDFLKYLEEQGDGGEVTLIAQWEPISKADSEVTSKPSSSQSQSVSSAQSSKQVPDTGDRNNSGLWITIMGVSSLIALVVLVLRKLRNE